MMNLRVLSTLAGASVILSLIVGIGLVRTLGRRRPLPPDTPPYSALHV